MEHFSQDDLKRAKEMANSREGQKLLSRLQQEKGSEIQSAIDSGDKAKLKSVLQGFLSDPEIRQLRQKLGETNHG